MIFIAFLQELLDLVNEFALLLLLCSQLAQHFDMLVVQPNFLFRFPQSRGLQARIRLFPAAAGETDLTRMLIQMSRALGQQDGRTTGSVDDWHQHPSRLEFSLWRGIARTAMGMQVEVTSVAGRGQGSTLRLRTDKQAIGFQLGTDQISVHNWAFPNG